MLGKAGKSRVPPGVHILMTPSPKIASLANFTANALMFPSLGPLLIKLSYFFSTNSTGWSKSLLISQELSALSITMLVRGRGSGQVASTLEGSWGWRGE